MTYPTLMVQLQLGRPHDGLLRIAGDLAEMFGAAIVGVAAGQPLQMSCGDAYVSGDIIQADFDEMETEIGEARMEFYAALGGRAKALTWRKSLAYGPLCDFVACEARAADLIVTGVVPDIFFGESRVMSIGNLVMQAGRPVLIVPEATTSLDLNRVLVAWNDTREARRAINDALPILRKAVDVTIVELASTDDLAAARVRIDDVVEWLARHGIEAAAIVAPSSGDDADELGRYARAHGADLIVAGAYGHSRLREWALGGVTRDLLLHAGICSLVSH